jgi:hypothetical protein
MSGGFGPQVAMAAGSSVCWSAFEQGLSNRSSGHRVKIVVIREAGLDGFGFTGCWRQTTLVESRVVDPAFIAVLRRRRRAKTDAIDGETLLRTLLAWKHGEPRVCAMVVPPTPEKEDRRRVCRERAILLQERIGHRGASVPPQCAIAVSHVSNRAIDGPHRISISCYILSLEPRPKTGAVPGHMVYSYGQRGC